MALFTKDEREGTPEPMKPPAQPAPRRSPTSDSPASEVNAQLGSGTKIEGKLTFRGSVHIDGEIDGEIHAEDTVVVGQGAQINARIVAATVIAQGHVEGDIVASNRLELKAPASLMGNISTPSLIIHEGVTFQGKSEMGTAAKPGAAESSDKRVAIFPTEDRNSGNRRKSEAAK